MRNQLVTVCFLILTAMVCVSCSTTRPYADPVNFDASSYINPEDYGYSLFWKPNLEKKNVASSFIPIAFKRDYEYLNEHTNYPRQAMMHNIKGDVKLQIYIDSTGIVQYIDVIETPSPLLTQSAIKVLMEGGFTVATLKGKPVNSFRNFVLVYHLRNIAPNERPTNYRQVPFPL